MNMQTGRFMSVVLRSMRVRRSIEIGVYTGYSILITAQAMLLDGQAIACDLSKEWTDIARRYWQQAGIEGRIELCLGTARWRNQVATTTLWPSRH